MDKWILSLSGYSKSGPSAIHLGRFDCTGVSAKYLKTCISKSKNWDKANARTLSLLLNLRALHTFGFGSYVQRRNYGKYLQVFIKLVSGI